MIGLFLRDVTNFESDPIERRFNRTS